ncbi:MAG: ABC transporter ATP-binding protein [Candidatus Hydrogenedentes bacterium]|nr:ABC transporter ATP-binding protein [Candidatus Hydrogenedentota bacterium]
MARRGILTTSSWAEARGIIWSHRRRIAIGLALVVVNRLSGLVAPGSTKFLVDNILAPGAHTEPLFGISEPGSLLLLLGAAVAAACLIQAATTFALSQVLGVAAQKAITDMRKRVQQHVIRLPVHYFDSTKTGVLISRIMTDAEGIRNLIGTGLVQVSGGVFGAAIALAVLLWLNWILTLVIVVVLGAFAFSMAYAFARLRPLFRERGELNAQVTGRLTESLGGVRVVKGYTAERREDLIFARGVHRLFRNVAGAVTGVSAISSVSTALIGIIATVMIMLGGRFVLSGAMTPGDLFMFLAFVAMVVMPLVQIANISTQFSEAFAGLDRIREIRSMATEDDEDASREPAGDLRGDIGFDNVAFEYTADVPVLKGVSFEASAGSTTALVGSSGSGKSTLIGLVMAFHRPKAGRVTVDGRDLASIKLRDYREHLGLVLQENFLFDGTIAENIAFSRPNAPLEEIKRVSKLAHCDEFIMGFEKGYDTIVGERGVKLSGGQRQRIAIARAILADPRILILDEATSSLDSESEAYIQDGLRSLRAGRTSFVIAHRLSTIRSADQILVLEHGEIVERGSHAELMALNGRYRDLHDRQYQFESNQFINPGEDFTPDALAEGAR